MSMYIKELLKATKKELCNDHFYYNRHGNSCQYSKSTCPYCRITELEAELAEWKNKAARFQHLAGSCFQIEEEQIQNAERRAEAAEKKVAELEAQLPEGMRHCTIIFEECAVGHGSLRGTNWVKNDCPWCRIAELEAELQEALIREEYVYGIECDLKKAEALIASLMSLAGGSYPCIFSVLEKLPENEQSVMTCGKVRWSNGATPKWFTNEFHDGEFSNGPEIVKYWFPLPEIPADVF